MMVVSTTKDWKQISRSDSYFTKLTSFCCIFLLRNFVRKPPCPNRTVKAFGSVLDATCNEKCRPCSHVKSSQRVNETAELPLPLLDCCFVLYWYMYALVIKALEVRPVVRRKFWFHYQISATWTWRVTTTIFFITWLVIQWQCGSVVLEPPIPLASVLSCPVVWAKSGKEIVRLSRWRHSSCTVESRIDRAENAMGLGWSHPRSPGDGQFGQENVQERSGAGRTPGMLLVLN